jgi:hypothetical protein
MQGRKQRRLIKWKRQIKMKTRAHGLSVEAYFWVLVLDFFPEGIPFGIRRMYTRRTGAGFDNHFHNFGSERKKIIILLRGFQVKEAGKRVLPFSRAV